VRGGGGSGGWGAVQPAGLEGAEPPPRWEFGNEVPQKLQY